MKNSVVAAALLLALLTAVGSLRLAAAEHPLTLAGTIVRVDFDRDTIVVRTHAGTMTVTLLPTTTIVSDDQPPMPPPMLHAGQHVRIDAVREDGEVDAQIIRIIGR
jgi:ferric-dicitrate binding protein FerR (iron transport regulator)